MSWDRHDPVISALHRYEADQDRAIAREERLDAEAARIARQLCQREQGEVLEEAHDHDESVERIDAILADLLRTAGADGPHPERAALADKLVEELWKAALRVGRRRAEEDE